MTRFSARFTPETLPELGGVRRLCLRGPGCGNCRDRPGLVVQADVGVPHRHPDIAVASQFTGLDKGCTVSEQFGDVSVPSHRVEVGETVVFVTVRNADSFQIFPDHPRRPPFGQLWEKALARPHSFKLLSQHYDQVRMERQKRPDGGVLKQLQQPLESLAFCRGRNSPA